MTRPINIVFIGSSALGLRDLVSNKNCYVTDVICIKKRITGQLITAAENNNLSVEPFEWHKGFRIIIERFSKETIFFIYQLDMLVPADLANVYRFFNIHRGSLFTNRGPNPDIWPILLGRKTTEISLHQIDDKIDSGKLIKAVEVSIDDEDTPDSVKEKMEQKIPVLIEHLISYLIGESDAIELDNGEYLPWITENDFTIDTVKDKPIAISRKIRCQSQYNGAILIINGTKYYSKKLISLSNANSESELGIFKDGAVVLIRNEYGETTIELNLDPKYSTPPVFPKSKRI